LGAGADERLSYGLAALADYIIRVDAFSHGESYHAHLPKKLDPSTASRYKRILKTNNDRYIWSRMHVENVRGKEYSRACHAVTVRPSRKGNDLYVVNAREEHVVPLIFG
jgi:hypothetical protein